MVYITPSALRVLMFIQQSLNSLNQPLSLVVFTRTATCPPDPALGINEVHITDTAIQQADAFADLVRDALPYDKIPVPILLPDAPSNTPHEEPDQPRFHGILLNINPYALRDILLFCQHGVELRVAVL